MPITPRPIDEIREIINIETFIVVIVPGQYCMFTPCLIGPPHIGGRTVIPGRVRCVMRVDNLPMHQPLLCKIIITFIAGECEIVYIGFCTSGFPVVVAKDREKLVGRGAASIVALIWIDKITVVLKTATCIMMSSLGLIWLTGMA